MPSAVRVPTVAAVPVVLGLCSLALVLAVSGCGAPVTTASSRAGATLVTYTGTPAGVATSRTTALVSRSDRGCFLLDGFPLTFPAGSRWGSDDGTVVLLPSGADVRAGDVVSGMVATVAPLPDLASYDCGVAVSDPVRGLVGSVTVQPRQ
ncbi:hypothetical protein [Arsenicicoccus sp. oral taxon 190]|uniref:hypothetical protein n=1 Tax=Arsenicicoccus sp. oral taxon 190 TaxID=1658671 RepID=UPI00067A073A|nr:hypothetical protein [Arsenicicoccus sp. oral taxon 190]AKT51858.1 hypothetical protein ADJ73_12300 [Arsenicicoccus sp. oral taxon 190]